MENSKSKTRFLGSLSERLKCMNNSEILTLPLDEILLKNGYFYKKEKNSRRFKTMQNNNGDLIVISQHSNGHYLYFNPNDQNDRGNIFNFCKNRGVRVEDILKNENLEIKLRKIISPLPNENADKTVEQYKNSLEIFIMFEYEKYKGEYRGIPVNYLNSYFKTDRYENILSPSYNLVKYDNGAEFLTQKGYISYLNKPLICDKDGNPYKKPIKQLCYGNKGLEIIIPTIYKKEIKNIVISESIFDSISVIPVKYNKELRDNETMLCSTNGQITQSQKEIFEYFSRDEIFKNAKIYLAFDNDEKGREFTKICLEYFPNAEVLKPILKDFNDDLQVSKAFDLKSDFSKKDLQKELLKLQNSVRKFTNEFEIYLPDARNKKLEFFLKEAEKFDKFAPKIENFIDIKEFEASFKNLAVKICEFSKSR